VGVGAKLPPLLLDDDEAVAVAVGLRTATGVRGIEDTSTRALAKLEAVLPHWLKMRVNAVWNAV
jgi:predicted DNA-binding transcriptional regulator YafY